MQPWAEVLQSGEWLALIKLSALLAVAWALHAALWRSNPRWRLALWRGTGVAVVALMIVVSCGPILELPWLAPSSDSQGYIIGEFRLAAAQGDVDQSVPRAENEAIATVLNWPFDAGMQPPVLEWPYDLDAPKSRDNVAPGSVILLPQSSKPVAAPELSIGPTLRHDFIALWIAGMLMMLLRGKIAARRVGEVLRRSRAASPSAIEQMKSIAARLELRRSIAFRLACGIFSPFLVGVRRPTIVAPESMEDPSLAEQCSAVLAHELTHVKNNDLAWMIALRALQCALWWHPLAWRIGAAHAAACERICDATAAELAGTEAYSETLARVALELAESGPAMGLPLARPAHVCRRLAWLAKGIRSTPLKPRTLYRHAMVGLVLVALAGAIRIVQADETANPAPMASSSEEPSTALESRTFNLGKKGSALFSPNERELFIHNVLSDIRHRLYGEYEVDGRRLIFNAETSELTIEDSPLNLARAADYFESLPEIANDANRRILVLKHAKADDVARILSVRLGQVPNTETTMRIRRGEERSWRSMRLRLHGVDANDPNDANDDIARLTFMPLVNGVPVTSQTLKIAESWTRLVGEMQIVLEDVQPGRNGGQPSVSIKLADLSTIRTPGPGEPIVEIQSSPNLGIVILHCSDSHTLDQITAEARALDVRKQIDRRLIHSSMVILEPAASAAWTSPSRKTGKWMESFRALQKSGEARIIRGPLVDAIVGRQFEFRIESGNDAIEVRMNLENENDGAVILRDLSADWMFADDPTQRTKLVTDASLSDNEELLVDFPEPNKDGRRRFVVISTSKETIADQDQKSAGNILKTRVFRVQRQAAERVGSMVDNAELHDLIWGQRERPAEGMLISFDERQRLLTVTGSDDQLEKATTFLDSVHEATSKNPSATPGMLGRIYTIRPTDAGAVNELIRTTKSSGSKEAGRILSLDGSVLTIVDNPENMKQIEDDLLEKGLILTLGVSDLDIEAFSLVPRDRTHLQPETVQTFTSRVVGALKKLLYFEENEAKAAEKGRRLWFDEETLALTIVDTPLNLERVREYIESLPQLRDPNQESHVVTVGGGVAPERAEAIEKILATSATATLANQSKSAHAFAEQRETTSGMISRVYRIKPSDGPRLRALANSIAAGKGGANGRILSIDGEVLTIRDTPENIKRIEDLMLDRRFVESTGRPALDIQSFSLMPRDGKDLDSPQFNEFTDRVIRDIKKFLYANEGEEKAAQNGRRLWFDSRTMQLTIVDSPANLERVAEYVKSLPQIRQASTQKITKLKHAAADEVARKLNEIFLKKTGETMLTLRRGEEVAIGPRRIRVLRVVENDPENWFDDEATVSVSSESSVDEFTILEGHNHAVKIFDTEVRSITPASGGRGDGIIRLLVRDRADVVDPQQPVEEGIEFNPIGELNVIVIRYTNESLFKEATDLIEQLDQPAKHVQLEFQFVTLSAKAGKSWKEAKRPLGNWFDEFNKMRDEGDAEVAIGPKVAAITGQKTTFGVGRRTDARATETLLMFGTTPRIQSASSIRSGDLTIEPSIRLEDLTIELNVEDPTRTAGGKPIAYRKKIITDPRIPSGDQYLIDWSFPDQPAYNGGTQDDATTQTDGDAMDSSRAMNSFFAHPDRRRFIVIKTTLIE